MKSEIITQEILCKAANAEGSQQQMTHFSPCVDEHLLKRQDIKETSLFIHLFIYLFQLCNLGHEQILFFLSYFIFKLQQILKKKS